MQARTRKRPIEEQNSSSESSRRDFSEESINWKDAAKEAFGNAPSPAINLRGLRNREGITQAELGKAIGVEQSNISKMEHGKRQIGVKIAKRLEKLYDIDYRLFL